MNKQKGLWAMLESGFYPEGNRKPLQTTVYKRKSSQKQTKKPNEDWETT